MAQPALKHEDFAHSQSDEHSEAKDELALDEPRTPGWLTALGGALFLFAIVWFIVAQAASAQQ